MACAATLFIAVAITHPLVEMGVDDDWSYIRSAQVMAETGRFVYNGWATAMLGWQLVLGGLFIKLFGFSFTTARISTLLIALLCTYLIHRIFLLLEISAANATTGTLLIVLSPIFLPLVPTFMSDIPGFFAILVCLYCCLRALQKEAGRASLTWLGVAAASNILLGTARQIAWLSVLVMVPSTAWLLRKRKGFLATGFVLWLIGLGGILLCMRWFVRQPYSVPEKLLSGPLDARMISQLVANLLRTPLSLALYTVPLLVAFGFAIEKLSGKARRQALLLAGLSTGGAFLLGLLSVRNGRLSERLLMPWLGNLLTAHGVLYGNLVGSHPAVLGMFARICLSLLTVLGAASCIAYLLATRKDRIVNAQWQTISARHLHVLLLPFSIAYFCLLVSRSAFHEMQDRYLITPLFLLVLYLLRFYQERVGKRPNLACSVLLTLYAAYSIAGTHDLFSLDRARLAAATEVQNSRVPRNRIEAGLEYDGWTQITAWGYMNDPGIKNPPGAYHAEFWRALSPCRSIFMNVTPVVSPDFLLSYDESCFTASPFAPVAYRTWLPPYGQKVYIRQLPRPQS